MATRSLVPVWLQHRIARRRLVSRYRNDVNTRQRILDLLRESGQMTLKQLAVSLGISVPAVRRHLGVLLEAGLVETVHLRGGAGRPALSVGLSAAGLASFPNRHDELANLLIEEIRSLAGSKGLQSVLMRVASRSAERYATNTSTSLASRVEHATQVINHRGSVADSERNASDEFLIHQRTCPFPNVARTNSSVCALEVEFVSQLTGGDARLVQSLLRGDACCTYRIRPSLGQPQK